MDWASVSTIRKLFDSRQGAADRLLPRWLFLRALGVIYFSAFFSLVFQIRGLVGPEGILPAADYLSSVAHSFGPVSRFWFAPTLLWFSSGSWMLMALCWIGMAASLMLVVNVWPRGMLIVCFLCFLSFVSAAQDFSGYQSDGMLLEAGFICLFFAPPGFRPGLGRARAPSRISLFLLQWEWLRIYFESGVAKIAGGDPEWRHFTAMDEYYQNGPLPTWIGWYVQHMPNWFHASTAYATLALELGLVWMLFLPRRWRILCFFIVTPWEIAVILTANYAFLNYLVLSLGFLLLDDRVLVGIVPARWRSQLAFDSAAVDTDSTTVGSGQKPWPKGLGRSLSVLRGGVGSLLLVWIFYATTIPLLSMFSSTVWLPLAPLTALEPFRIANRYGLFAIMTRGRYEIEFQGSRDGSVWLPYPFRFKPQEVNKPPGIYAPYQPRFDWNLWFASLGSWREYPIVLNTEVRLLANDQDVLALFAGNPFAQNPPRQIRVLLWQYWFTTMAEKNATGLWWRRELLGRFAPTLAREADGRIGIVEWPSVRPRQ